MSVLLPAPTQKRPFIKRKLHLSLSQTCLPVQSGVEQSLRLALF